MTRPYEMLVRGNPYRFKSPDLTQGWILVYNGVYVQGRRRIEDTIRAVVLDGVHDQEG